MVANAPPETTRDGRMAHQKTSTTPCGTQPITFEMRSSSTVGENRKLHLRCTTTGADREWRATNDETSALCKYALASTVTYQVASR